jgi:hypothetical protein
MNTQPSKPSANGPTLVGQPSSSPFTLRGLVLAISLGGFLLWVLLEFQQMPYRPPSDMSTFLGAPELAFVRSLILLTAIAEVALIICFLVKVSLEGSRPGSVLTRAIRIASTLVVGLLLTFAVGYVFYDNFETQLRIQEADRKANSVAWAPHAVEYGDADKGVKVLEDLLADDDPRFENLCGLSLDRILKRARLTSAHDVIVALRKKTGKDYGDDPKRWIEALRSSVN